TSIVTATSTVVATSVNIETAAYGSGTGITAKNVTAGSTFTAFAIQRDVNGNFVANAPSTWSLTTVTGGVVAGDLVPAADNKSAVFTGHLIGSAKITAS